MATAGATTSQTGTAHDLPRIAAVGISEVYVPPPHIDVSADVVFVHGLKGHPKDTWTHGKETNVEPSAKPGRNWISLGRSKNKHRADRSTTSLDKAERCYWPFHLLSKDLRDVRILVYGYDSHPTHFYRGGTTRMTITQHAEDLMHKVVGVRSECRGRPLIFIAHSLGGILVKGALNESKQMPEQQAYSDLQRSCYATIFMGTPHLGADTAAWGEVMSNLLGALPGGFSTYSGVLRGLEPDSETLYSFSRRFNDFLNAPIEAQDKIQICSVQEGQGMTSVKGAGSKVVPDYSSKFNRTDVEQSFFNQTANHMNMCKFATADDQAYKDILGVLKGYCQVLRKRKVEDQEKQKATQSALVAGLREKFNYESRLFRERQLNSLSTVDSSLDWIWTSSFLQWIASDAKMFWIAGHPASGKSTLMNYVADHVRTFEAMRSATRSNVKIVKFFFDYRGKTGIGNNFRGLRRSLVYQLLETSEELTIDVEERFGLHREGARLMLADDRHLSSILDYILQASSWSTLLFMDGLDEYEGHKPDLFALIKHISSFGVKVCLSSRFEIPFSIAFRDTHFQLRMDKLNLPGVEAYARTTLQASLSPSSMTEAMMLERAASTIAKISNGVFLWAHFAVSGVIDAACFGRKIEEAEMQLILRSIPPALNEIYERLFKKLNSKDRQACGIVLRLISTSERPLEVSELYEATHLAGVEFHSTVDIVREEDLLRFQRYIQAVGSGVVEIVLGQELQSTHGFRRPQVAFSKIIHRSVQTYLDQSGWIELLGTEGAQESHHLTWLHICAALLVDQQRVHFESAEISTNVPAVFTSDSRAKWPKEDDFESETSDDNTSRVLDLAEYVHWYLPHHALRFEQETHTSCWSLIHSALDMAFIDSHVRIHVASASGKRECCCKSIRRMSRPLKLKSDVHFAIAHRLVYYVEEALPHRPELAESQAYNIGPAFADDPWFGTGYYDATAIRAAGSKTSLLRAAILCFCQEPSLPASRIVHYLIPRVPRLNSGVMLRAIGKAPMSMIEALLSKFPAGPLLLRSRFLFQDHHYSAEFGPLWAVAGREDGEGVAEILRLFLSRGEEINRQCGPTGTVLHATLLNLLDHGHNTSRAETMLMRLFRMFIDHGADINAKGQNGNVLEYLWRRAHTHTSNRRTHIHWQLIGLLIDLGATNETPDPNGIVPTKEYMLGVATSKGPNRIHRYFYKHGGVPPAPVSPPSDEVSSTEDTASIIAMDEDSPAWEPDDDEN